MPTAGSEILTLPAGIGRRIIEAGTVIARPLLGTDQFVKFCRERGVSVDRQRLLGLEKLGVFAPVFRVRTPPDEVPLFSIPVGADNNWFDAGWAWDTTGVPATYPVPDPKDRSQEGYYSVFQLDYLHYVLTEFMLSVHLDGFLDDTDGKGIDWAKNGVSWLRHARDSAERLRVHEYRRAVALLCQYVSNRYYPPTQGDRRRIQISAGHSSDRWVVVSALDWDWHREARAWDPQQVAALFDLTAAKLRHAYESLAIAQARCDPLERWYQLVQFVAVRERKSTSIHSSSRYVTRPEYIRIWNRSFEFDSFSCSEIAAALRELAQGHGTFATSDVTTCRAQRNPGSHLKKLYRERMGSDLPKLRLVETLVARACSDQARRLLGSRPIIKTLNRVASLAVRNPLPVMFEIWEKNQASKYFGKKRRTQKRT